MIRNNLTTAFLNPGCSVAEDGRGYAHDFLDLEKNLFSFSGWTTLLVALRKRQTSSDAGRSSFKDVLRRSR